MPATSISKCLFVIACTAITVTATAQVQHVEVVKSTTSPMVNVTVNGKPFTTLFYPDTLEKPVLYPIYAADGQVITRGYPLSPRADEPTDHPHHIGLWFNYESVNGLDFWNNSFAIAADKKKNYGWIQTDKIVETKSGNKGLLTYAAHWHDINKKVLLNELTTFTFSSNGNTRVIDRVTTLTATDEDVHFKDVKDGLLGLRVAHELQLPDTSVKKFTDDKGNVTNVQGNAYATGNYVTSEGKTGNAAWGTRGQWCMLYGKEGADSISIAIIDHPGNIGYPTYWHARDYGLFSANPLGQKIFNNGKETLNFTLEKGKSVTFRYRIIIYSGNKRLSNEEVDKLSKQFAKMQ